MSSDGDLKASDKLTVIDDVRKILTERYSKGFLFKSPIELERMRDFLLEINEKYALSNQEILACVGYCGTQFGDRIYIISEETKKELEALVEEYFSNGRIAIFYTEFYEKNEDWLFRRSITSEDMTKEMLQKLFPEMYFTRTFFGSTDSPIPTVIEKEILNAMEEEVVVSYEQINKRLKYIPLKRTKLLINENVNFLYNCKDTFSHISKVEIDKEKCRTINEIIQKECDERGYTTMYAIPCEEFTEQNPELSTDAIRTAIFRTCLADRYDRNLKVITRKGYTFDDVTMSDDEDVIRIDKSSFVSIDQVDFDVEAIDEAIEHFVKEDYLPIKSFTTFATFPHCGQTWNMYLLESYCIGFSEQFRFEAKSANSRNIGVVVRNECKMSYDNIMIDAVAKSSISLEEKEVARFLFENGYLGQNSKHKARDIISKATIIRERRNY